MSAVVTAKKPRVVARPVLLMSMLLRLLSFVLCIALLRGQGDTFFHQFGEPGTTGSFRAQFVRAGAGVYFLQSTDHWRTLAAKQAFLQAKPDQRVTGDYLMLAYHENDHALRLFLAAANAAFPVDPAIAPWQVRAEGSTVRFTLDAGNGLELEKVLRHDGKQRGFELELVLRNKNAQAAGSIDFVLGGPTLISPQEPGLFLSAAAGIVAAVEAEPQHVAPKAGVPQPLPIDGKTVLFAGTSNRFFGAFLWPRDDGARAALRSCEIDTVPLRDDPVSGTLANTTLRARYGITLPIPAPGAESKASFGLYLGPKSYQEFATLPEPERFTAIMDVDLNAPCCFSVTVPGGRPMAKLLLTLLGWFHGVVGNWGLAIMMLTILVRGLLAPLNFHMQKSMRAYSARMAVLKPKMDALKKQHGDDQRAYQQAMLQFQRENKVLPPLGGCLPMFAVMPVYLGLFTALRTAYDVRQQPFIAWIDDLSRPDGLFQLPFWPDQFNLLPILWLVLMLVQVMRQPLPTDPQQRQQMQIMRYMPLIFGVMLYSYAAALLVYMVTSMLWTFVESAVIKRILGPIDPNVAAMTPQTF